MKKNFEVSEQYEIAQILTKALDKNAIIYICVQGDSPGDLYVKFPKNDIIGEECFVSLMSLRNFKQKTIKINEKKTVDNTLWEKTDYFLTQNVFEKIEFLNKR